MAQLISIGQIIDQTFHLYQKHFTVFIKIGVWLLWGLPLLVVTAIIFPFVSESMSGILVIAGITLLNTIITILIGYFVTNSLVYATETFDGGKKLEAQTIRTQAWSRVGVMVLQGLLLGLMLFGAVCLVVPGIGIFVVGSVTENAGVVLPSLGMFLLFAGGIAAFALTAWFAVIFPFAPFALLLEDRKVVDSIRRAFALIKGRWWATMLRVLVPKLTFGVIVLFIQLLIVFIIFIISSGLAPMAEVIGENAVTIISSTLQQLSFIAVAVVTTPVFIIADYYVFQNLAATRRDVA